jgi:hypothetical protein
MDSVHGDCRLVGCRAADDYTVWLLFDDGVTGTVYLGKLLDLEAFERIRERPAFRAVRVDDLTGTLTWAAGIRLDPGLLYDHITARWRGRRRL